MHFVYVLYSKERQRLYVGRTEDLEQRLIQHRSGKTWTTYRMGELELICYEAFKARNDAIRREHYFKTSKGKSSLKQIIRDSIQSC